MKPYYEHAGITIFHGNCADIAPYFSTYFDSMIVDPPYGETSLDWDRPCSSWLLAASAIKNNGTVWCFGSMKSILLSYNKIDSYGLRISQDIIWEKHNGSNFHSDRFKRVHEHILQFYRKTTKWEDVYKKPVTTLNATARTVRHKKRPAHTGNINQCAYESHDGGSHLMRSVIFMQSCHGHADHPTQKPIGIINPLIEYSCPKNGIILDPMMGSGSVLIAAKNSGRRAIGIEIEERYCEIAAKRLSQECFDFSMNGS